METGTSTFAVLGVLGNHITTTLGCIQTSITTRCTRSNVLKLGAGVVIVILTHHHMFNTRLHGLVTLKLLL